MCEMRLKVGVQVIKAGESADKIRRVCDALLERRKARCSQKSVECCAEF